MCSIVGARAGAPVATAGYTCPACRSFVPLGARHACPGRSASYSCARCGRLTPDGVPHLCPGKADIVVAPLASGELVLCGRCGYWRVAGHACYWCDHGIVHPDKRTRPDARAGYEC